VNGRTGKVGGKYPVSPLRVAIAAGLGIAAVLLLAYVFMSGDGEATVYIQNAESYLALTV
ncbi:MAG: hypothetical protein IJW21_08650, partial [Clostridia bacterium]|nr:hypothetical protein [Clostridia bacterium]